MKEDFEEAVLDAALIGAAQRVEHYEIAAYGTACEFAQILGESEHASLLKQTLEEERAGRFQGQPKDAQTSGLTNWARARIGRMNVARAHSIGWNCNSPIRRITMSSPASIKNHPIHPMLVAFPLGLWVLALVCDIVRSSGGSAAWSTAALYSIAGGIVGAVLAAVTPLAARICRLGN